MYREYFGGIMHNPINRVITNYSGIMLHKQDRDWTCSIACLKTILCITHPEDWFIDTFHMEPGPFFSKDLKMVRNYFKAYKFVFGSDDTTKDPIEKFIKILLMVENGWSVMIETMYNYSHWLMILGFYPHGDEFSDCDILLWDPYLGKTRLENAEEVISMWIDGDFEHTNVKNDYIAVRHK